MEDPLIHDSATSSDASHTSGKRTRDGFKTEGRDGRRRVSYDEAFSPPFHSTNRAGSLLSSVFSLVSTILGGGVLSLPYAFSQAGVVVGALLLVGVAAASDYSAFSLAACSRRADVHTVTGPLRFPFDFSSACLFLLFSTALSTSISLLPVSRAFPLSGTLLHFPPTQKKLILESPCPLRVAALPAKSTRTWRASPSGPGGARSPR